MSKTYTITEYDKEDIEALDDMSKDDVVETHKKRLASTGLCIFPKRL